MEEINGKLKKVILVVSDYGIFFQNLDEKIKRMNLMREILGGQV